MRLKMRRLVSTLLFGLACSVITALHISSQRLPDTGETGRSGRDHGGDCDHGPAIQPAVADGENRGAPPAAAAVVDQQPPVPTKPPGVRLHQRGMAWAVDDPSSSDTTNSPRQPQLGKSSSHAVAAPASSEAPTNLTTLPPEPRRVPPRAPVREPPNHGHLPVPRAFGNGSATLRVGPPGRSSSAAPTELEDIFIGVKTTGAYHKSRVQLILDTWLPQARAQTFFFTDRDDPDFQEKLGDHLINTRCAPQHSRQDLCCKVAFIYDSFLKSGKRWFCHLDDDNYLNVPNLVKLLRGYSHKDHLYLGRASLDHPIQALDRDRGYKETSFWFATGGAGFCISQSLALRMAPLTSDGQFVNLCSRVRLPDDVSMGFIIDGLLHVPLTRLSVFNSHLQGLSRLDTQQLREQVTLSYYISRARNNTLVLNNAAFTKEQDPTRIRSLHCMLYPEKSNCT